MLNGVEVKLKRATEHLAALRAAVEGFIATDLKSENVFMELDEDLSMPEWKLLKWSGFPAMDPALGAVLGDFVHNLRSGLDQLMWVLVKANGGEPGRHTQWPVSETPGQWRVDVTDRDPDRGLAPTAGISAEALTFVEDHQPFKRGRKERSSAPLNRLHKLSNVDKHRTLHAAMPFPSELDARPTFSPAGYYEVTQAQKPQRPAPIQDGVVLLRFKLRELKAVPDGMKIVMTPPGIGIHVAFYADEKYVVALDHLDAMLSDARAAYEAALLLPEIASAP